MPIQKLNIYDIIVDIFPGLLVGILGVILLFPAQAIPSISGLDVGLAIILLALGYILGRAVHGFASGVDSFVRWSVPKFHQYLLSFRIYEKVSEVTLPFTGKHYTFSQHMEHGLSVLTPFTLKSALAHQLIDSINKKYNVEVDQLDEHDMEEVKYLSYSILYNKDVLYRRYEILATFFRSLYVVFFFSTLAYSVTAYRVVQNKDPILFNEPTIWIEHVSKGPKYWVLPIGSFFILSLISLHQRRKFSHRRGRALIYDAVNELKRDE